MIPFFELREISIGGGYSIAVFGTLVCLGVVLGVGFAQSRARALGVPDSDFTATVAMGDETGIVRLLAHHDALRQMHQFRLWRGPTCCTAIHRVSARVSPAPKPKRLVPGQPVGLGTVQSGPPSPTVLARQ